MRTRLAVVVAVVVACVAVGAGTAGAGAPPTLALDRREVAPGEAVIATMTGFEADSVTVSVCGNLAKRGSQDCAMSSSEGDEIVHDGVSYTQLVIQPPPAPCPCLVRAVANGTREFAVSPLVVIGHPVAPVVDPGTGPIIEVEIDAAPEPEGVVESLRSALGGRTRYAVTVSVRNITTEPLDNVVLSGSARHRWNDDATTLALDRPGLIQPGETWEQTVQAEVPAPVWGRYTWTVAASGAGESVQAEESVSARPVLFLVLAVVFVLDGAVVVWRLLRRRRRRIDAAQAEDDDSDPVPPHPSDDDAIWGPASIVIAEPREVVPV